MLTKEVSTRQTHIEQKFSVTIYSILIYSKHGNSALIEVLIITKKRKFERMFYIS